MGEVRGASARSDVASGAAYHHSLTSLPAMGAWRKMSESSKCAHRWASPRGALGSGMHKTCSMRVAACAPTESLTFAGTAALLILALVAPARFRRARS